MGKKKNGNGKELAIIGDQEYAILKSGADQLPAILEENVGAEGLSSFDLDRIKIPAGGGISWEIPTIDGLETATTITGVVVFHKPTRVYWQEKFDGQGQPPDCSSDDAVAGNGKPGGDCKKCSFAVFGSAENKRGQSCKQVKQIFFITADSLLPKLMSLPPMSLGVARKFFLRLANKALPYYAVSIIFGLEKAKNQGGIEYSRVTMTVGERLTPDQVAKFKALSATLRPHLEQVRADAQDYTHEEEAGQ